VYPFEVQLETHFASQEYPEFPVQVDAAMTALSVGTTLPEAVRVWVNVSWLYGLTLDARFTVEASEIIPKLPAVMLDAKDTVRLLLRPLTREGKDGQPNFARVSSYHTMLLPIYRVGYVPNAMCTTTRTGSIG
jgi:hypothetical protein